MVHFQLEFILGKIHAKPQTSNTNLNTCISPVLELNFVSYTPTTMKKMAQSTSWITPHPHLQDQPCDP